MRCTVRCRDKVSSVLAVVECLHSPCSLLGYRLPRPPACPEDVYTIMLECWEEDVERRCKIHYLVTKFEARIATKYDQMRRSYSSDSNPLDSTDTDMSSDSSTPYQYSNLTRTVLLSTTAHRIREEDQTYSEVIVPSSDNCQEWHQRVPKSQICPPETGRGGKPLDNQSMVDSGTSNDRQVQSGPSPLTREYSLVATNPTATVPPTSHHTSHGTSHALPALTLDEVVASSECNVRESNKASGVLSEIAVNPGANLCTSSCFESSV